MQLKKRYFITFLLTIPLTIAFGQVANSPFSAFGVGDLYGNSLVQNQGMGGVGISNPSSWYINNQNPALLVNNYVTSFQAGMIIENRTLSDGSSSLKNSNGNLSYLVAAFPIKPGKWTTSVGLTPYSSVNYKLTTNEPVVGNPNASVTSQETGSGGINQAYWSNGIRVHKNIAVGVRANYLFSSIITQSANYLNESGSRSPAYYPLIYERNYVNDFSFSSGIYFHKDSISKKNFRFNVGLIYDFKSTLDTRKTIRIDRRSTFNGTIIDSTTLINNEPGTIVLPQTIGAGISFGKPNYWTVGMDFSLLDYEQFKGFNGKIADTNTSIRSSIGFEIVPDPTGIGNYLERMTYRTGISYDQYPYLVGGKQVKDFGINFGFSLPVARISTIDVSLKIGTRGSIKENSIEENYFKIYLGMTFNDNWFIKRKFD